MGREGRARGYSRIEGSRKTSGSINVISDISYSLLALSLGHLPCLRTAVPTLEDSTYGMDMSHLVKPGW